MPARRRSLPPLLLALVSALLVLAAPASAGSTCIGVDAMPGTVSSDAIAESTLCLINSERAGHGLAPLRAQPQLEDAATRYARDMADRHFFSHVSPSGVELDERLDAAGWLPSVGTWHAAENIAWGTGVKATPAEIVDGWMHSAGHRANILDGQYDRIGIGVVAAAPVAITGDAATYVTDFGVRGDAAPAAGAAPSGSETAATAGAASSSSPSGSAPAGATAPTAATPRRAALTAPVVFPLRDAKRVNRCVSRVKRLKGRLSRSAAVGCVRAARKARIARAARAARVRVR